MPISDPISARILVYNTVVDWMAKKKDLPRVEVGRTFMGPPPGGYGFSEGAFLQMCDDITDSLRAATQRKLTLSGPWRVQHERDVISAFMNAVAVLLIAGAMTPAGRDAHTWAMS